MIALSSLHKFLDVRVVLKLSSSLCHQSINPSIGERNLHCAGDHLENVWTEDIVKIVFDERSDDFVALLVEHSSLLTEFVVYHIHIFTVHDGAALLMTEVCYLIANAIISLYEGSERVIERCSGAGLLSGIKLDYDFSIFEHDRHDALIVDIERAHLHGVESAFESKLSMYHVA